MENGCEGSGEGIEPGRGRAEIRLSFASLFSVGSRRVVSAARSIT